jgi:hypothetical protein
MLINGLSPKERPITSFELGTNEQSEKIVHFNPFINAEEDDQQPRLDDRKIRVIDRPTGNEGIDRLERGCLIAQMAWLILVMLAMIALVVAFAILV